MYEIIKVAMYNIVCKRETFGPGHCSDLVFLHVHTHYYISKRWVPTCDNVTLYIHNIV